MNPPFQQNFTSGDNSAGGGTDQPTGFEPDTPRDRKQKPVLMVSPLKTRSSEQGRHGIQLSTQRLCVVLDWISSMATVTLFCGELLHLFSSMAFQHTMAFLFLLGTFGKCFYQDFY